MYSKYVQRIPLDFKVNGMVKGIFQCLLGISTEPPNTSACVQTYYHPTTKKQGSTFLINKHVGTNRVVNLGRMTANILNRAESRGP